MRKLLAALAVTGCHVSSIPDCYTEQMYGREVLRESSCPAPFDAATKASLYCVDDVSWHEPQTCDYEAHSFCAHSATAITRVVGRAVGDTPRSMVTLDFREMGCRTYYEWVVTRVGEE